MSPLEIQPTFFFFFFFPERMKFSLYYTFQVGAKDGLSTTIYSKILNFKTNISFCQIMKFFVLPNLEMVQFL